MNSLNKVKDADVSVLRRTRRSSFTARYAGERDEERVRSDAVEEGENFRMKGIISGEQQLKRRANALREKERHAIPSGEEGSYRTGGSSE